MHLQPYSGDISGDFWMENLPPVCHYTATYLTVLLQRVTNFCRLTWNVIVKVIPPALDAHCRDHRNPIQIQFGL